VAKAKVKLEKAMLATAQAAQGRNLIIVHSDNERRPRPPQSGSQRRGALVHDAALHEEADVLERAYHPAPLRHDGGLRRQGR
jgi:hypothetical protein